MNPACTSVKALSDADVKGMSSGAWTAGGGGSNSSSVANARPTACDLAINVGLGDIAWLVTPLNLAQDAS